VWREKGAGLMRVFKIIFGLMLCGFASVAQAQQMWVQIDAQPTLSAAMARAQAYSAMLEQVQGYRLPSGGYAVVLGPMEPEVAVVTLQSLLTQNMIASDSALADGQGFGPQFWPVGAQATNPDAAGAVDQTQAAQSAPEVVLNETERREVQTALKWFGFYAGLVDGNIGSGSRAGIANWQTAQGFDPTGVLTADQRAALVDTYQAEQSGFGFETVNDPDAGIEISLPMAMVAFDRATPPFVRFSSKGGSGVTALLISQPGGTKANLAALYDVLQSLDIMPVVGDRALEEASFSMQGRNGQIETLAYAQIVGGAVKGFVLSWDVAKGDQMQRVVEIVQSSFRSTGDVALDPGLVPLDEAAKRGLLAGLAVKQPKLSRTGFFIDQTGSVLTTIEAVDQCGTITLDQSHGAKVTFTDKASGLAVLTPDALVAPRSVAAFATTAPQVGSAIAVSGYSYGARLPAPVLTQGMIEEATGLNGETGLTRLTLQAMPGDAGGPVMDGTGVVVGMLLPAQTVAGKQLPAGVAFAATSTAIVGILTNPAGPALTLFAPTGAEAPTPNALNAAVRDMTVLVSCWK
jgi:hypothetical protein